MSDHTPSCVTFTFEFSSCRVCVVVHLASVCVGLQESCSECILFTADDHLLRLIEKYDKHALPYEEEPKPAPSHVRKHTAPSLAHAGALKLDCAGF